MSKDEQRELEGILLNLAAAQEDSSSHEAPLYAPADHEEAARLTNEVTRLRSERASVPQVREAAVRAAEAHSHSSERAGEVEAQLGTLVRLRTALVTNEATGYWAPEMLNEAEELFCTAVTAATGDYPEGGEAAIRDAAAGYVGLAMRCLAAGPVASLRGQLDELRPQLSAGEIEDAEAEIAALEGSVRVAQDGGLSVDGLRTMVTARAARLSSRLGELGGATTGPGNGSVAPGGGWAPGTYGPPERATKLRVVRRRDTSLAVGWQDPEGVFDVQLLERSVADGPFAVVRTVGRSATGWTEVTDTGLSPDTLHRYRVTVQNQFSQSTTRRDDMAVAYTRTTDDLPVWRVQVRIRVADIEDGGSTDSLEIRLQSPLVNHSPNGNSTWLGHAPRLVNPWPVRWNEPLDRGSVFTYDVRTDGVRQLGDITMLTLRKPGSDALAVAELNLLVNGVEVFQKLFGETASTCLWVDEVDGFTPIFTVYQPELRASALWRAYVASPAPIQLVFSTEELVSRFEATLSHLLHDAPAHWQHATRPVRARRAPLEGPHERLIIDLALRLDVGYVPDPNLNLSLTFAVHVDCNATNTEATLVVQSTEYEASLDLNLLVDVLLFVASPIGFAVFMFNDSVKGSWDTIAEKVVLETPGICPTLQVIEDDDGDASIRFT